MLVKKIFIKLLFVMISTSMIASAQDFKKTGSSAAQFLKIPVGARAVALGNTFASISNDVSSMYWNPAGMSQIQKFTIGFTRTEWIADMNHDFLGMVLPLDGVSSVGISVTQLSTGDIENTTILQPKGTGIYFDAADLAVSVSYARQVIEQVSVGLTAKYINQRIWNTSAQTFAIDFGVLLKTGYYDLNMGFSLQNFGPELIMRGSDLTKEVDLDPNSAANPAVESSLTTQPFSLPTSYRGSISMGIVSNEGLIQINGSSLILALDAFHSNDIPEQYSIGMEYGFMETFYLRGGYLFNTDEKGLTLGSGIDFNFGSTRITFDYAYADFGIFNAVHIFSISMGL